jgi:hypothetical protein
VNLDATQLNETHSEDDAEQPYQDDDRGRLPGSVAAQLDLAFLQQNRQHLRRHSSRTHIDVPIDASHVVPPREVIMLHHVTRQRHVVVVVDLHRIRHLRHGVLLLPADAVYHQQDHVAAEHLLHYERPGAVVRHDPVVAAVRDVPLGVVHQVVEPQQVVARLRLCLLDQHPLVELFLAEPRRLFRRLRFEIVLRVETVHLVVVLFRVSHGLQVGGRHALEEIEEGAARPSHEVRQVFEGLNKNNFLSLKRWRAQMYRSRSANMGKGGNVKVSPPQACISVSWKHRDSEGVPRGAEGVRVRSRNLDKLLTVKTNAAPTTKRRTRI